MQILGLVFAGTATPQHREMTKFVRDVLRLPPAAVGDPAADDTLAVTPADDDTPAAAYFELPDGGRFAVATERDPGAGTSRTIGFLVGNLAESAAELRAAGVEVDDPLESPGQRYAHFIAPDGELSELIEQR